MINSLESQAWPDGQAHIKSLQAASSIIFALSGAPDETPPAKLTRASYGSQSLPSEHIRGRLRIIASSDSEDDNLKLGIALQPQTTPEETSG